MHRNLGIDAGGAGPAGRAGNGRPRVLFVCGSGNQTTQMHAIARALEGEIDASFTPFYGTGVFVAILTRLGLLERTIAGGEWRRSALDYFGDHALAVDDRGVMGGYDLVVKCQDIVRQSNLDGYPTVLVQEGMTDPETLLFEIVTRVNLLPLWFASTAATGLSHRYDRFCVASTGYRDLFVSRGVDPAKVVVTGIPNFDDLASYAGRRLLPLTDYVLVVTSDARETYKLDDRKAFLARALRIAAGRPLVFKLHPNEHRERAVAEIRRVAPGATIVADGKAEELIGACAALVTEYSTCSYTGLALGKEVHSHFDEAELRRLMPLQNGRAAEEIADVCRAMLRARAAPVRSAATPVSGVRKRSPMQPSTIRTPAERSGSRINTALTIAVHAACLSAFFVPFTRTAAALAVGGYVLRMWAITTGYHRYFSHRSFKTGRGFQFFLACVGASAIENGPLWWASWHRRHHRHSDEVEDRHSPVRYGFWQSHTGWYLWGDGDYPDLSNVQDLAKFPELVWIDKYKGVPLVTYAILCTWIGGLSGLVWGFFGWALRYRVE